MRTFGAFLMIAGANLIAGSFGLVFYFSRTACALAPDGCSEGSVALFFDLLFSRDGIPLWILLLIGIIIFWRGKSMRARPDEI